MPLFSTMTKHATLGAVLTATGLATPLASAQFKVEYADSQKGISSSEWTEKAGSKDDNKVFVISSDTGEHSYEVKIVNGIVEVAKLDGKKVDHSKVKVKHEIVVFLSDDGKVLHEIKLPGMAVHGAHDLPAAPNALGATAQWVSHGDNNNQFVIDTIAEQPKVMLGINLTEPSDAMRKQLRLGEDQKVILIEKVIDGLPAKLAGLEKSDIILSIDGSDYANGELLSKVLRKKSPGDKLKLVVLRGGDKLKISPELTAYDGVKLGVKTNMQVTGNALATDFAFPTPPPTPSQGQAPGDFAWMPQIHERLHKALDASGLDEEEIARVTEQLHEHLGQQLGQFGNRFFSEKDAPLAFTFRSGDGHDAHAEHADHDHDHDHEHEQRALFERAQVESQRQLEMAEALREKARVAMRDVESQVMELRDGRLLVRSAEQAESHLDSLEERLSSLEERLESQMEQFEAQMERMADMFERLLDRLEDRD